MRVLSSCPPLSASWGPSPSTCPSHGVGLIRKSPLFLLVLQIFSGPVSSCIGSSSIPILPSHLRLLCVTLDQPGAQCHPHQGLSSWSCASAPCCVVALVVPVALVLPIMHSCVLAPLPAIGIAFLGRRCRMVDCRLHSCVVVLDIVVWREPGWDHCREVGQLARRRGLTRAVAPRPATP